MDAEVRSRFFAKLAEVFEVDPHAIQPDFALAERWDSVVVLATIAAINEQFGITVPVDELTQSTSVAELLAVVAKSAGQPSAV